MTKKELLLDFSGVQAEVDRYRAFYAGSGSWLKITIVNPAPLNTKRNREAVDEAWLICKVCAGYYGQEAAVLSEALLRRGENPLAHAQVETAISYMERLA